MKKGLKPQVRDGSCELLGAGHSPDEEGIETENLRNNFASKVPAIALMKKGLKHKTSIAMSVAGAGLSPDEGGIETIRFARRHDRDECRP